MSKPGLIASAYFAVVAVFLLALSACAEPAGSEQSSTMPCQFEPLKDWSCEPRDVSGLDILHPVIGGAPFEYEIPSVEEVIEEGLHGVGASPTHIAIRGAARGGMVRCDWHGVALTPAQREEALRFWLDIDSSGSLPTPSAIEATFAAYIAELAPQFRGAMRANFNHLVHGGVLLDGPILACYADYDVHEYLLGAGPTTLTVAYDDMAKTRSYDLYRRSHEAGRYGAEELWRQGPYAVADAATVSDMESALHSAVEGRESVLFLAPMGAHSAIAVEAWQVVEQWDLQTDASSTVHAVRYGVSEGDPEHTQTLTNLKARVTTAAANDAFADDRIADASGLTQYYRDIGAYDDITPDDGSTATFTPAQPPAALACASGTAVTSPETNRGLVHDCEALLDHKDTLRGSAALNWSAGTAIASWDGVTTGGTPSRVTKVELSSESLTGTIPAELGRLFELTHLDLSANSLTGDIPRELGWLFNLEEIRLSGNSLTRCIPLVLRDVAVNDLASLNLLYCQPPAPGSLAAGTIGETSVPLTWGAVAGASTYRVEYRPKGSGAWTVDDDTLTGASHAVDGLLCESEYEFRVSAYGSGTTYAAAWSEPSEALTASTGACVPPVFDATSYAFPIAEDAAVGATLGSVSATAAGGSAVTYAVTAGDDDDLFAIGEDSGELTVAGSLSGEAGSSFALTVEARGRRPLGLYACNANQPASRFAGVEPLQRHYEALQAVTGALRSRYESLHSRYGAVTERDGSKEPVPHNGIGSGPSLPRRVLPLGLFPQRPCHRGILCG